MILGDAKRTGRPRQSPVDRLRAKHWYYAVKSRTTLSDYQLDLFFLEKLGRRPKDPQMRSRIFETIRLHGTLPSNGNHPKRDFDLIQLVEEEADFVGTAELFYSPYWQLLTRNDFDIAVYHDIAQAAMDRLGLARTDYYGEKAIRNICHQGYEKVMPSLPMPKDYMCKMYGKMLQEVMKSSSPTLDNLVLLGALFREAYLACALEIAIQIRDCYCELLTNYVCQDWLDPISKKLQEIGEGYLVFSHAYDYMYGPLEKPPYDDFPFAVVERPIWYVSEVAEMNQSGVRLEEWHRQQLLRSGLHNLKDDIESSAGGAYSTP
ncbi:hypothetical protein [Chromobacterium phragmitis]|uniref:Uncharacterized protein n=1 Tax=Chromobacterium phragmitis TaxID=2202141 RepID=A0A344UJL9_9NEIS|nr:hypothetical protein [Chromobacterium phragmitis]AXE35467.1 hypothetical protein DK843_14840 [Chromobacterium phragmitis]